jgi:hypothetical protein|tara:strand:+ start:24487 stop:24870 length:384 start_codon:yes stop_codon:yes gene_type:complete
MNRHFLTAKMMASGWSIYLPVYDDGIDLLATRTDASHIIRVQLKSRWTIGRKYLARDIYMAFPDGAGGDWYLAPHADLVTMAGKMGYTNTTSWQKGGYSVARMPKRLREWMSAYRLSDQLVGLTPAA